MSKQEKTHAFVHRGAYPNMPALIDLVTEMPDSDWEEFTYRQKTIIGHKQTKTIPLMFDKQQKSRDIRHRHYPMFEEHLMRISDVLAGNGCPSSIKRANIVKLLPRSEISAHKDVGNFLNSTRRIHLAVQTNDGCTFTVGKETMHIPTGELWEINNTGLIHSVHNNGDTDRIHLIVDVG